jgi:hypothetical protein
MSVPVLSRVEPVALEQVHQEIQIYTTVHVADVGLSSVCIKVRCNEDNLRATSARDK